MTTGVDAFVTIQSLQNGATVTNIDQTGGVGYDDAFQPIVNSTANNPASDAQFSIQFKTTGGANYAFPNLAATGLDIDGSTMAELEFCKIDMNGGNAKFQANVSEINIVRSGTGFQATNITGNNFTGIDSAFKEVMFTVYNTSVQTVKIDFGAARTSGSGVRNYAVFFRDFIYPFQKAMPLKLVSFSATATGEHSVRLDWVTSEEINTDHFVIEQSLDGTHFYDVGRCAAVGTTVTTAKYSFALNLTSASRVVYFRLKTVDRDGRYYLSYVRMAIISQNPSSVFQVYPNPCVNRIHVALPASWQSKASVVTVYSVDGRVLFRERIAGRQEIDLDVASLRPGSYLVSASSDTENLQLIFQRQ